MVWARCRCCWASTPQVIEQLFGEQYRGKERLLESNVRALHRATSRDHLAAAIGLRVQRRQRRATASSSTATRRGAGLRVWRRHGLRLVPDHALVVGGRGLPEVLPEVPRRPGPASTATPSCRPRTRSPPSAWSPAPAGTARAPSRPPRARRVADDRVHRPGLLRRDPDDHHQRAARRPVHRHADPHAAGRPVARLRVARRHQAPLLLPQDPGRMLRARRHRARPADRLQTRCS